MAEAVSPCWYCHSCWLFNCSWHGHSLRAAAAATPLLFTVPWHSQPRLPCCAASCPLQPADLLMPSHAARNSCCNAPTVHCAVNLHCHAGVASFLEASHSHDAAACCRQQLLECRHSYCTATNTVNLGCHAAAAAYTCYCCPWRNSATAAAIPPLFTVPRKHCQPASLWWCCPSREVTRRSSSLGDNSLLPLYCNVVPCVAILVAASCRCGFMSVSPSPLATGLLLFLFIIVCFNNYHCC